MRASGLMAGLLFMSQVARSTGLDTEPRVSDWIQRAGNAQSDEVRLKALKELQQSATLESSRRAELDKFIKFVETWIDPPALDWFGDSFQRHSKFDFGVSPDSPLFPLTHLYTGRMWVWTTLEYGGFSPEQRRERYARARSEFEVAVGAFPEDLISHSYLGKPIPPAKRYDSPANAPAWAVHQREALERVADIVEWWIDHRMHADGQYGGGWGDDCEMWRWWVPVLIAFDSPRIHDAQARFSDALMQQPYMSLGYTNHMSDVEHTAEDSADAITPMMHLDPENPLWVRRAGKLAELMETLWTGKNERGFLQFRSTYFTGDRVSAKPDEACDTVYHPRAVQPALLLWQRTGDAHLTRLFSAWMDTWVDATARSENGKPTGIIPSAIHWPDGKVGGLAPEWWDPHNHREHTLYEWPSAMELMTHTLLLTYHMTGNDKYLAPIRSMAQARLEYVRHPPAAPPVPGTKEWCASMLTGSHDIGGLIGKYRVLTGDASFDELLPAETPASHGRHETPGAGYMRYRLTGDLDLLTAALQRTAEGLRFNFHGYTSEVRYTDRVLRFPSLFGPDGIAIMTPAVHSPDTQLLYSTAIGDPGGVGYFPMNAVRWLTSPREIAALVTQSSGRSFEAELFHFGKEPRKMAAELYGLQKGSYSVLLTEVETGKELFTSSLEIDGQRARVAFTLPAGALYRFRVNLKH